MKSWSNGAIFWWGDILVRRILDVGGLVSMAHHKLVALDLVVVLNLK
jgi:hypothetical protein